MAEADRCRSRSRRTSDVSLRTVGWHLVPLVFLVTVVAVPASHATIVVPLSEEALVDDAVAVVVGHVTSIGGHYDQTRRMIFTDVTVAVDEVLKGELTPGDLTLRQRGGSVGDRHSWVAGSPEFTVGEKVLLFLRVDQAGNLRVAHLYQGKFTVTRDAASGDELAVREIPRGVQTLRRISPRTSSAPDRKEMHRLRDLTDRIRQRLRRVPRQSSQQPATATRTPAGETGTTTGVMKDNYTLLGSARWFEPDGGLPVPMKFNGRGEPLAPTGGFDQVRQAMRAWSSVTGSSFRFLDAGFTDAEGFRDDGVNAVSFRDPDGELDPPVSCSGTLGVGGFFYTTSESRTVNGIAFSRIIEGDLVFNDGWAGCNFYENFNNFAEVAVHELGHVVGLAHSSDPDATMYPVVRFDGRGATLRQDDIDGLLTIYPGVRVTLRSDRAAPQPIGTTITFTAEASGAGAPHQCKWFVTTDPTWATSSVLRDWGACNSAVPWTPTAPSSYWIAVWARTSWRSDDAPEAFAGLEFPITTPIVTVTATPVSPQPVNSPIIFQASATGGTGPHQCKWFVTTDPMWATYSVLRDWFACTIPAVWTPTTQANYIVAVWTRSNGSVADAPEASTGLYYSITAPIVTMTSTPVPPQSVHTPVSFTASVRGGTGPHQCKWFVTTDPTWATYSVVQGWQPCATPATWTPVAPAGYIVAVWAKSTGNPADAPEASSGLYYVITAPLPLAIQSVAAGPASPQPVGTTLSLTASVTGGTGPQQCKWFWTTDPTWATYSVLRNWLACTTPAVWTPTASANYIVAVWARSSGNGTDAPETGAGMYYTVTPPTVAMTTTPPSPQVVGTPLAFSASVSGGTGPHQCKWFVTVDPTWATSSVLRDWDLCSAAATWTPTAPWNYIVAVWARSAGAVAEAPEGQAGAFYGVLPNVGGVYTGGGTIAQSACRNPGNNGTFPATLSLDVFSQVGANLSGRGTMSLGGLGGGSLTMTGAVTPTGQVSGSFTVATGFSGNGTFHGNLSGSTMNLTFTGAITGGETCSLAGWFTLARP